MTCIIKSSVLQEQLHGYNRLQSDVRIQKF